MSKPQVTNWKKHMVQLFKDSLGRPIPVEILDSYPEIQNAIALGDPAPQTAEVIVAKIIRYAVEKDKANLWAIQMIYEYVVGKPQQAPQDATGGRHMDDKLENVTTDHLNALASQFAASGGGVTGPAPNAAPRQLAGAALDLPEDGAGGSQGAGSEPEMA